MTAIITAICGVCTLVPYIYMRCKKRGMPGIILKIATSVFFLLTTLAATLQAQVTLARMLPLCAAILAGQIFGLLGDFWLDMKDMYPQHKDPYVFAGFTSFLIGHLFFFVGLWAGHGMGSREQLIALGAGAALALGVIGTEKMMKLKYGKFKGITAGYSFVFGFVIAVAFQVAFASGALRVQPLVMAIGLVVFLLSDLVLSGTFFGQGKDRPIDYTLNYIFYYGGQFTISLSLLALL